MKKTVFLCCLAVLYAGPAGADLDTVWTRTYGGPGNDGFRSAIRAADGGYVAAGYTHSFGAPDVNIYVVRTDAVGDTLWTRTLGGSGRDYGCGICEAADGGFVVAGYTTSWGAGKEDVYVAKIDSSGNVAWERTYGGAESDEAAAVCSTSDGYLVVAGRTESFGSGRSDVYLLKLDAEGDTAWARVFGGAVADWGQGVCETADGYYGVSGTTGSDVTRLRAYVLKVDPGGTPVWQNAYGTAAVNDINWGMGVCAACDSGLVIASYTLNAGNDPCDASMLGVDRTGARVYYRKYADYWFEYGYSVCETRDGGYLSCGTSKDPYTHTTDLWLLKRVPGSGWVWEQAIGGAGSDWGSSIQPLNGGYYVMGGQTDSRGAGGYDGWLLLARDADAGVPRSAMESGDFHLAPPSPSPVSADAILRFSMPRPAAVHLAVYDILGREVAVLAEGFLAAGAHERAWNGMDRRGRDAAPGVYYVRLVAGDYSQARKLVLVR